MLSLKILRYTSSLYETVADFDEQFMHSKPPIASLL